MYFIYLSRACFPRVILGILSLFFGIIYSASSYARNTGNEIPLAEAPFDLINNRVQIRVKVREFTLRFLLDTGASRTVLFQSEKYPFNDLQTIEETNVVFPALDETVSGLTLAPLKFSISQHSFFVQKPLLILDTTPIGNQLHFEFEGILGQDFFNSFVIEVNPKTRILKLYPKGTKLKKRFRTRLKLHMKGHSPHIRLVSKLPWERYAKSKSLLLDSGYPGSMVIWDDKHFQLASRGKDTPQLKADNIGIFTHATFEVGNLRFIEAPVFISANPPKQARKRQGLLGGNVLNQFHYVIDFGSKKLWLSVVGVHRTGIDGGFYPPNNEEYIVRDFNKPETSAVLVIE